MIIKKTKKNLIIVGLVVLVFLIGIGIYVRNAFEDSMVIKTIQYDNNLKIYVGGGCNSIVLTSEDGKKALVVDTKYFKGAQKLRQDVKAPDITIVNTHFHMDHARGNKLYPNAYVISGDTDWGLWDFDTGHSKRPDKIMNPGEEIVLKIGSENVHIINMGKVHSPNDCVVYLEKRKMLISGDLVWVNVHPVLADPNCSITLWLKALDKMDTLDVNTVVPGHGNVSNKDAIKNMREYFVSITEAIGNPKKLQALKNKYKGYTTIPIIGGFDKTVDKIKKETKIN